MIKDNITSILTVASITLTTQNFAGNTQLSKEKLTEIASSTPVFKKPNISVSDGVDEGSYYFLQLAVKERGKLRKVNAFLEKDTGAVYIGHRYDKNGKKATFPKTDIGVTTIKNGISFSYGNGKKDLYIVTDPECPYCKTFEKEARGKLDDYTVHVILYPLSFHKRAPAMVEWIMQGKDDADKLHRMEKLMIDNSQDYTKVSAKKGEKFKYSDDVQEYIDNGIKAAKVLGATGTPSVYTGDFKKINWKSLTKPQVIKLPTSKE